MTTHTPGQILAAIRATPPLVHCITNYVAMNIAANVLLAAGASPAMVHAPEEAEEFAALSDGLTINIGTLSEEWLRGMQAAIRGARSASKPWVLDPVAHFATAFRRSATETLVAEGPTVIRGNASEILALAGQSSAGRGVDAGDGVEATAAAASDLASRTGAIVALTGTRDFVTDGRNGAWIEGGSPLMPQVTALGCALTALTGAFVAARPQAPFEATVAALALYAMAGERAAGQAQGPGSFQVSFLDALAGISPEELDRDARIDRT